VPLWLKVRVDVDHGFVLDNDSVWVAVHDFVFFDELELTAQVTAKLLEVVSHIRPLKDLITQVQSRAISKLQVQLEI